ncbi:MAG: putative manganese-dependent inorganic pyrophosphatase [Chloroflexi bacterium]|nr:putative manganese-dependent inorganic pyrophosphatase [Chloroflexota bacterium]
MKDLVYVIGHVNPDTDSVASAIGYAWLLRERDGQNAVAARAGSINPQTVWALDRLSMETPVMLTDVSPRFESVTRRMDTTTPDTFLREAWDIATRTGGVAPIIREDGIPYGLITGLTLFSFLTELIGPHQQRQEMKIAEILELSCHEVADTGVPKFKEGSRIRDAIRKVLHEERNYFFVVNEKGHYTGICRQRDILNPPRVQVVLVDHNEFEQAVGALEEAELLEVIDHHRLGNQDTRQPIRFTIDVVGSTSTLISERIIDAGLSAPPEIAGVLLAGLLSDTLMLTSPTTTDRDNHAAERLGRWAFSWDSPLQGETLESFGESLLESGAGLSTRDPQEIVNTDLKTYEEENMEFGISQAEVTDLMQVNKHLPALKEALEAMRISRGLDFSMLMVTDVVRGSSRLIISNSPPTFGDMPYPEQPDGTRLAEGVVSRKKQLLPVVLSLLEGAV